MSQTSKPWWNEGLSDVCTAFQMDLSCLVDGELDEPAAGRAMLHLEECTACRDFFEGTRDCLRLHLDVADPDRLLARLSTLTGTDLAHEACGIELVHRLATIFYQLGKAYLLTAIDPNFRTRVFERAMSVETTQCEGRGFVDGVLLRGETSHGRVDWQHARALFNGRLKKIDSPREKARKLLQEAIAADPSHEEAQLYMAYLHSSEGKTLKAADGYRRVFDTGMTEANRGHAAMQLGLLHCQEDELRKALTYFRWVSLSGIDRRDERFFVARFNTGVNYTLLANNERGSAAKTDRARALDAFRGLIDAHPSRISEIAELFASSRQLQQSIEAQEGFIEALAGRCPELFRPSDSSSGPGATDAGASSAEDGTHEMLD
jgi:tetratricopeptide (TPR) repeat protein